MRRGGSGILRTAGGSSLGLSSKDIKSSLSRNRVIPVAGYFYFQIDNWSEQIMDQWPRNPVFRSDVHQLYGNSWQLVLFPRGSLNDNSEFVEVQLVNRSNRDIQAKYTISIYNFLTEAYENSWSDPDGIVVFRPHGNDDDYWGNCEFITLESLQALPFTQNDSVRLKVEIVANIEDQLGALTPTTSPMGDVKPGTSLEIAKSDLQQLSTYMSEQKVRMIEEEQQLQDSLVRKRVTVLSTSISGSNPVSF